MSSHLSLLIADVASHAGDGFHQILPFALGGAVVLVVFHLIIFRLGRGDVARWNWWRLATRKAASAACSVRRR